MNKASKVIGSGLMAGMLLVGPAAVDAAEVTVGADLATAYVYLGETINDGFVFQPYLDLDIVEGPLAGLSFGVWGNIDIEDMDGEFSSGNFSEVDFVLSYALPIDALDISIGYTEFITEMRDADREIELTLGYDLAGFYPFLGLYYGIDGADYLYTQAGVAYEMELIEGLDLGLSAAVAHMYVDDGESGFHDYTLSASLSYGIFNASLTYYGQIDDDVLTDEAYDVEFVGTFGISYTF